MEKQNNTENIIWWISWGKDAVHYGTLEPGAFHNPGQPNNEEFHSEEEWVKRCLELGVNPIPEEPEAEPQIITPPPTIEQRLDTVEAVTAEIIVNLNEKGIVP